MNFLLCGSSYSKERQGKDRGEARVLGTLFGRRDDAEYSYGWAPGEEARFREAGTTACDTVPSATQHIITDTSTAPERCTQILPCNRYDRYGRRVWGGGACARFITAAAASASNWASSPRARSSPCSAMARNLNMAASLF